jgi:hypothetical protein
LVSSRFRKDKIAATIEALGPQVNSRCSMLRWVRRCLPGSRAPDARRLARVLVYMLMGSRNAVSTDDRQGGHGKNENRFDVLYTN